jgi:hypothetical protein
LLQYEGKCRAEEGRVYMAVGEVHFRPISR